MTMYNIYSFLFIMLDENKNFLRVLSMQICKPIQVIGDISYYN